MENNFQRVTGVLVQAGAWSEESKLTAREIGQRLNVSKKTVYNAVDLERTLQIPIISTKRKGGGFFLANTDTEDGREALKRCCRSLSSSAEKMKKTADCLAQSLEGCDGG